MSLLARIMAPVLTLLLLSCDTGFSQQRSETKLSVEIITSQKELLGTREKPRPLVVNAPEPFRIVVRALDASGRVDTSFRGYVRLSARPGAVEPIVSGQTQGRNIFLDNGISLPTDITITNAYGQTYILADDLGYAPAPALGSPRPACSNGIDDDGDGTVDFPADEGCAFADDNTEQGGSYAIGASEPIFYALPRVADTRGLLCTCADPQNPASCNCRGTAKTPYPKEPVQIDTGVRSDASGDSTFAFSLVVTRIAPDGFYVTDISDRRGGYSSLFAFNFNAPPNMRVCDRLKTLAGTTTEFFGLTQLSYPTWTLEEWSRPAKCLVPEPTVLGVDQISPTTLLPLTSSLVRVETVGTTSQVYVAPKLGPKDMPKLPTGGFAPAPDATNCDLNRDGSVDFTAGTDEATCSDACKNDPECSEYSNFLGRGKFRVTLKNEFNARAAIQVDTSSSADFRPLERKGQTLRALTGTLHYFSGGTQFTIEARCKDDIVIDTAQSPLASDKACVNERSAKEEAPQ